MRITRLLQRRSERTAAAAIYGAAVEAGRRPALFREYGIPDSPQGRFEAVTLHLFVVLYRLMHRPGDDAPLARLVAESFVTHMDATLRESGVGDTVVPKRMRAFYGAFAGRMEAYKAGLEAGERALAEAIARNAVGGGHAENVAPALAGYVLGAVEAFQRADLADIRAGRLPFPELPAIGPARGRT